MLKRRLIPKFYIKYIKRGYTRPSHLASLDVRNGRLTREQAMAMVSECEGRRPPSLDLFLEFVGITEVEFMEVALSHRVSPWEGDGDSVPVQLGRKTHDFEQWTRHGEMEAADAAQMLDRWRRRVRGAALTEV